MRIEFEMASCLMALCPIPEGGKRDHEEPWYLPPELPFEETPSQYFNYYATQVMRQAAGRKAWRKWQLAVRDLLLDAQAEAGHQAGSWSFAAAIMDRAAEGGCTIRPWPP